jgi:hypothetical protein
MHARYACRSEIAMATALFAVPFRSAWFERRIVSSRPEFARSQRIASTVSLSSSRGPSRRSSG